MLEAPCGESESIETFRQLQWLSLRCCSISKVRARADRHSHGKLPSARASQGEGGSPTGPAPRADHAGTGIRQLFAQSPRRNEAPAWVCRNAPAALSSAAEWLHRVSQIRNRRWFWEQGDVNARESCAGRHRDLTVSRQAVVIQSPSARHNLVCKPSPLCISQKHPTLSGLARVNRSRCWRRGTARCVPGNLSNLHGCGRRFCSASIYDDIAAADAYRYLCTRKTGAALDDLGSFTMITILAVAAPQCERKHGVNHAWSAGGITQDPRGPAQSPLDCRLYIRIFEALVASNTCRFFGQTCDSAAVMTEANVRQLGKIATAVRVHVLDALCHPCRVPTHMAMTSF